MPSCLPLTNKLPLLPYSQLVWEMEQQMPGVYDIPLACHFNVAEVDIERLKKAVKTAINNHPVFADFGRRFFSYQIEERNGIGFFKCTINRILGDWFSLGIFIEDVFAAYQGLSLPQDTYIEYIQEYLGHQQSEKYQEHKQLLENKYKDLSCPLRPTVDFPLETEADWLAGEYVISVDDASTESVCLATAIAIMDYCGSDEAALTWAYLGRNTEVEQYIFGSLHKDIPMLIQRCPTSEAYWKQLRQEMRFGIRTSDYPLTLTHPYTNQWNYAVNVIEKPNLASALANCPFKIYWDPIMSTEQPLAYSLLDIEIEEGQLRFKYSATHYKAESMERFAQIVAENMGWLKNL